MSSSAPPPNPPNPDPTAMGIAAVMGSVDKMAMYVGGQVQQTQMQTNMMNLMGMRMQMTAQQQLDNKLEIAMLNYEARMREAEMGHKERMTELADTHVERLAESNEISLDSKDYSYPYQWGTA